MSSTKKESKTERINLEKLSTNGMKNLALAAGISYISQDAIELVKKLFFAYLEELVRRSAMTANYKNQKTIKKSALEHALQSEGAVLVRKTPYVPSLKDLERCQQPPTYPKKNDVKEIIKNKIKFVQQKRNDCVYLSKQGVMEIQDLILENMSQFFDDDKVTQISEEVRHIMHYLTEEYIIDLFQDAALARQHASRSTLMPADIHLVMAFRRIPLQDIERVLVNMVKDDRRLVK